jgi:hypothetical protein
MKDEIDNIIQQTIEAYDGSYTLDSSFEELVSFGELVDRLSIVNFKLFTLKDQVMNRTDDNDFKSWASVEDVKLVRERSRLKKCIDEKLIAIINRIVGGDVSGGFTQK